MCPERSDVDLLRLVAAHDPSAFRALADRHQRGVFRFARRMMPDEASAEDVLQETFLAIFRGAGKFSGEGSVKGWIFAIARNAALGQLRKKTDEPRDPEALEILGRNAGWGQRLPDIEEALCKAELLEAALSRLSAEECSIILLRDVEGLTGQETAQALGLSSTAMKSRLHRARLKFAAELRKGDIDG